MSGEQMELFKVARVEPAAAPSSSAPAAPATVPAAAVCPKCRGGMEPGRSECWSCEQARPCRLCDCNGCPGCMLFSEGTRCDCPDDVDRAAARIAAAAADLARGSRWLECDACRVVVYECPATEDGTPCDCGGVYRLTEWPRPAEVAP